MLFSKQGFTAVESLIAIVILVVALAGILMSFSKGTSIVVEVKDDAVAARVVQEQIELLRSGDFNWILTTYSPSGNFNSAGLADLNNGVGTITVDYPFGATYPSDQIIRITVSVAYTTSNARARTKSMTIYLTKDGLKS